MHSKICLIDDLWGTCGSANLVDLSLHRDHTELNVAFWHAPSSGALLRTLVHEHTHEEVAHLADAREVLERLRRRAVENRERRRAGEALRGHVYELDPRRYGAG